jgi:hypothetical protein
LNERDKVTETAQAQDPETVVPGGQKGKRLGIREFVLVLVIILVVWAAQKCYSAPSPLSTVCDDAVNACGFQVLERTAP